MKYHSFVIAVLLGFVGRTQSQPETKIEGEVFIVTKDADNIRLGAIEIRFYPEAIIRDHITQRQKLIKEEMPHFDREIARLDTAIADMRQKLSKLTSLERQMGTLREDATANAAAERLIQSSERDRDKEAVAKASWPTAQHYFRGLPATTILTRTDADGRFSIQLHTNQVFTLAAHAVRETFSAKERFYWLIRCPTNSGANKILLSNHNLVTSESDDSMLHTKSAWYEWSEP
jgi:hypothetical protein